MEHHTNLQSISELTAHAKHFDSLYITSKQNKNVLTDAYLKHIFTQGDPHTIQSVGTNETILC